MDWYFLVWQRYADFSGRSRRAELWYFVLFNTIVGFGLELLGIAILKTQLFYALYSLAASIPSFAVQVRRLHDTDRSGWWLLIWLIPIIGWIVLIVFFCENSQPGDNRFGPNPKLTFVSA